MKQKPNKTLKKKVKRFKHKSNLAKIPLWLNAPSPTPPVKIKRKVLLLRMRFKSTLHHKSSFETSISQRLCEVLFTRETYFEFFLHEFWKFIYIFLLAYIVMTGLKPTMLKVWCTLRSKIILLYNTSNTPFDLIFKQ
jgi:hypothetical protein